MAYFFLLSSVPPPSEDLETLSLVTDGGHMLSPLRSGAACSWVRVMEGEWLKQEPDQDVLLQVEGRWKALGPLSTLSCSRSTRFISPRGKLSTW